MKPRLGQPSGVTALVLVVLLLVPALAWLQYRWLGQVSEAERERMQRTLRTSAMQFATAFDTELSRTMAGLQLEGSTMRDENWTAYAQRYTAWTERAGDPRLVRDVLLVDAIPDEAGADAGTADRPARPDSSRAADRDHDHRSSRRANPTPVTPDELRLRRWNTNLRAFEPAEWTDELTAMRPALADHFGQVRLWRGQGGNRSRRDSALSFSVGDDFTLLSPVTLFDFPDDRNSPPRIDILGFLLLRLDRDYVTSTLLPALSTRHFPGSDGSDYRIAVTDRREPSTLIWESEPGAAGAIDSAPDVEQAFMSARPEQVFMITRGGDRNERVDITQAPLPPAPFDSASHAPPRSGQAAAGSAPSAPSAPSAAEASAGRIVISVLEDRRAAGGGPPPPPGRGFAAFEGRWRLTATHRAGSLEAAVAAVRTRNLMLSSGILLLLTTAIGLIVVSARRAQTLARQQMEFVAAVSHELRTPVSVIGSAASNLADGVVADPSRVRKYGETIQGEARRLGETVERVLQLAGIAAGSSAAARGAVDVTALVQQAVSACRPEIEARGVTVELSLPDGLPPAYGDAASLRSAVQNLISNAVKYGGDARWVRIDVSPAGPGSRRADEIRGSGFRVPGSDAAPSSVAISVSDRGLGISPDDRRHIFEPFYRGREAVARQIQGSGLGLNLVSRIAEAHDGRVEVTSEPGKGSTFTLVLPASPDRAAGGLGTDLVPNRADAR